MIPADLFNQLREKDPELWERYKQWSAHMDIYDETALQYILQGELQEAIRARGWLLEQSTFTAFPSAKIWKKTDPAWRTYSAPGSTEAEALVKAYLAAISHK